MIIKDNDINYNKLLGIGAEGSVYFYKNEALKIFNHPTQNKEEKLKILKGFKMKNFILPKELIYNQDSQFKGYLMDKVEIAFERTIDFKINSLDSLNEKIEFLKKQEQLIKEAHKNNIILVDMNYHNFLVNKNDELFAIDVDNYYVDNYKNDINPTNYYNYFTDKVNKDITKDIDKMSYTLNLLYLLTNKSFSRNKLIYFNGEDYIEEIIKNLVLNKEVEELLLEIVSDSINKPYINNELDSLKSEERYIMRKDKWKRLF